MCCALAMKASPVLLVLGASLLFSTDASITKFAEWHRLINQAVSEYIISTSALSGITCVRECMKHSQCDSCAYDRESGTCYLQVETNTTTDTSVTSVEVFTAFVPCTRDPARDLLNISGTNITWRKNGWNIDGVVICNDDFMYIGDSPTFRCSATGQWTVNHWECRQRIWRNPKVLERLTVPKTPEPGWTVCMIGTPTEMSRFSVNLASGDDIIFHVDFRFQSQMSTNTIVFSSFIDGAWGGADGRRKFYPMDPFPVIVNQTAKIVVKAITLSDVEVFVDGAHISNYTTHLSVDKVTTVFAKDDVSVDMLDLWFDQ